MDVGGYRIVSLLAESRLGRVHLARSASGRPVVVRTVPARLAADQAFRERFRREAAAGRAVTGRYAAAVLDAGPDAEEPWVAIEFCAGPGLPEAVATHGPLDDAELGALGAALAEALAGVHAAGVPHRDVKPSNVVVTRDGPKLLGFGVAKPVSAESRAADGRALGSPGFVAPELLAGDARPCPAADVFALGAVLAVAATGRGPFGSGRGPEVLSRTLHEEPDLLGVPGAAWPWFIGRCLTRDPAQRPSVAETLAWCAGRAVTPPWWETEPVADLIRVQEEEVAELLAWAAEGAEATDTGDPYAAAAGLGILGALGTAQREQPTVPAAAPRDPRIPWR
ncbi:MULTISPECIES: serine/threonine-protein kinase [Streptomyces]|uniref:serine/threonine-protein kinase n=1 Tax=Streptomyces TaxID=1883 RepID=UPI001E589344|nr:MULTISPECIES: serine/threonine-protein kinase [Streptomyces]UFQ14929.1 serine/threonine protein kinase [Streptomyces huasconensis]WCL84535.1 serine/threonine-protein kinase [Streptomyces sp. JCM 35825]